ncbi:hypothetical protein G7077_03040 [Sphingomonas piscis]|uniref:Gylcosyl hydrolase 115 C-terminal domain-containing protein n=1 Tax=Sphingomonas piscis TaxID=2714943 RepID=A0A6G7YMS3_9SPHN|nr:glycosyl hydrolase 115 family protein [Sphingomonas piscis]QIK78038.1 hypothetical protein G7077_03040 [Sphingomonas piscis]
MRLRVGLTFTVALMTGSPALACSTAVSICSRPTAGSFVLVRDGVPAPVFVDGQADTAVRRVADELAGDLQRVSGRAPLRLASVEQAKDQVVIIGTLGQSPTLDSLIAAGKLKTDDLKGLWEAYRQIVVEQPFPGIARALVIVGADRRGAVFGAYDLSEKMGVSPWHWFADVPVKTRINLWLTAGERRDEPKVRYRGIFINDEDPAFSGWAKKQFGGVNAKAYARVFELILRLKGNYLWPAMWGKSIALDDPASLPLADDMGIVLGTSHHEPMTRAQAEWHRGVKADGTGGAWNYTTNAENLRKFWRGGIERMMSKGDGKGYENLVTVGMRGDGDEPMSEGTATELLETIVADQRKIIADVTGKPASETPQVWALYKEVQDYYDKGMKVPDDVTLLFADDNWGQIRRLPDPARPDLRRRGGYGVYYHFDYVGGPRNYKWLNTNQIGKVWQQMDLAYRRDARNLWVVNVGDIKPMEYPLSFFMKMAWNPEAMTVGNLRAFPRQWAAQTFGDAHADEIARLVTEYSEYAARRKPELLDQNSYPLGEATGEWLGGGEFGRIVADWQTLAKRSEAVRATLPADQQSAYFQLVHFPIVAVGNLYEMYYGAAWNKLLAARNDARANHFADVVERTFARDSALTAEYHAINGGKWDRMMSQVHMSYVIWNDPTKQTMPSITRVAADTPEHRRGVQPEFRAIAPRDIRFDAVKFDRATAANGVGWKAVPDLGLGDGALVATPQGSAASRPGEGPNAQYDFNWPTNRPLMVSLRLLPTLNTINSDPLRVGVSVDDGPVQTLSYALTATGGAQNTPGEKAWAEAVINNSLTLEARYPDLKAGKHVLKIWRLDDNVVVDEIALLSRP